MAVDRGPVLKRCRTLGISPAVLGLDKKIKEDKSGKQRKKTVNIPSYLVNAGDKIEIAEKAKETKRYKEIVEVTGGRIAPSWIDADVTNMKATIKNIPTREEIDVPVNEMLIVELYSK